MSRSLKSENNEHKSSNDETNDVDGAEDDEDDEFYDEDEDDEIDDKDVEIDDEDEVDEIDDKDDDKDDEIDDEDDDKDDEIDDEDDEIDAEDVEIDDEDEGNEIDDEDDDKDDEIDDKDDGEDDEDDESKPSDDKYDSLSNEIPSSVNKREPSKKFSTHSKEYHSDSTELQKQLPIEYIKNDLESRMSAFVVDKVNELKKSQSIPIPHLTVADDGSLPAADAGDKVREFIDAQLSAFIEQYTSTLTDLTARINDIATNVQVAEKNVDYLEQFSKKLTLLFHGLPYSDVVDPEEVLATFLATNLDIHITERDIVAASWQPPPKGEDQKEEDRPRVLHCIFAYLDLRNQIYYAKKKLKGTQYAITEDLTKRRSSLYQKIKNMNLVAWTYYGEIYLMDWRSNKVKVESIEEVYDRLGEWVSYGVDMISVKQ